MKVFTGKPMPTNRVASNVQITAPQWQRVRLNWPTVCVKLGIQGRVVTRVSHVMKISTSQALAIRPVQDVTQGPPVLPGLQRPRNVNAQ